MVADLESRPELDEITNVSNSSITFNLLEMFATAVYLLEKLNEQAFVDMDNRSLEIPTGTLKWYAAETLNYQHGDTLTVVNGIPSYAVEDDTKKVVKLSSATEQDGAVLIKAAKLDNNDKAIKLDVAEISGLEGYWVEKRFAGTSVSVISQDGDELTVTALIEVDGTIISSTGESIATPGEYPVEDAITTYLQQLDFNGKMLIMELSNAIEAVNGVKNVVITACAAKPFAAISYTDILATSNRSYVAIAGYMIEDTLNPFSSTLTYSIV